MPEKNLPPQFRLMRGNIEKPGINPIGLERFDGLPLKLPVAGRRVKIKLGRRHGLGARLSQFEGNLDGGAFGGAAFDGKLASASGGQFLNEGEAEPEALLLLLFAVELLECCLLYTSLQRFIIKESK